MPNGYKIYTGSSPEVTAKAVTLLSQEYGYSESIFLDGKDLLFVVEEHTWYGANPEKPAEPHKGVTVYERIEPVSLVPPTSSVVIPIAIGIGALLYRILKRKTI